MTPTQKEYKKGNRAFYWTPENKHPLCLQSREYNREMTGVTWVYFSKTDAKELLKFLQKL